MALRIEVTHPGESTVTRETSIGADLLTMMPAGLDHVDAPTPAALHERKQRGLPWPRRASRAKRLLLRARGESYAVVSERQIADYVNDRDALPSAIKARERDIMRTASTWGATTQELCALSNHMRVMANYWQGVRGCDIRPAVALQCEYWAIVYAEAQRVAIARALRASRGGRNVVQSPLQRASHMAPFCGVHDQYHWCSE